MALMRGGYIAVGANQPLPYEGEEEKGQSSVESSSVFGSENEKMLSNSDEDESMRDMIVASPLPDDEK